MYKILLTFICQEEYADAIKTIKEALEAKNQRHGDHYEVIRDNNGNVNQGWE